MKSRCCVRLLSKPVSAPARCSTPAAIVCPVTGDAYPVTECMVVDGIGTMIASLFGSPFGTVMYFGHPAHKKSGAKTGYRYRAIKAGAEVHL